MDGNFNSGFKPNKRLVFHKHLQRNIKISGRRESVPVLLSALNATPAQVSVAVLLAVAHTLALSLSPPAPQPVPRPQRALRCHGVPQVPGEHGTSRFPTRTAGFPPSQRRRRSCHRYCSGELCSRLSCCSARPNSSLLPKGDQAVGLRPTSCPQQAAAHASSLLGPQQPYQPVS